MQHHGFWTFNLWFLSERIILSPTQYFVLLVNLFVTLQQSDSSVKEKMGNYQAEIYKLRPRDKKCCIVHSNHLGCNQITKFISNFQDYRDVAMNWQFHDKRQSWAFTNKEVAVGKLFEWSKKIFWSHAQYKLEEKSYKMRFKALPVEI